MGCCQHGWPSWGGRSPTRRQVQCAWPASVRQAGRQQQGEEPAGSWFGQLCLLHPFSTHSWFSFLLEPFGTIRANIRVKPPRTKLSLTTGAALPVPSGTHFNSGVTQLQTFPNSATLPSSEPHPCHLRHLHLFLLLLPAHLQEQLYTRAVVQCIIIKMKQH